MNAARAIRQNGLTVKLSRHHSGGSYWGAGYDVLIATTPDGAEEVTVRARNVTEARKKVAAELARQPGEVRSAREPIGGNSPHTTRHEIDWVNPVTGQTVRIRIIHAREYLFASSDHLQIESIAPEKAPLPITGTGYLSHFISPIALADAGGAISFVTAWIEWETKGKAWTKAAATKAQGDLFQWADAHSEFGAKRPSRPKKAAPKPGRKTIASLTTIRAYAKYTAFKDIDGRRNAKPACIGPGRDPGKVLGGFSGTAWELFRRISYNSSAEPAACKVAQCRMIVPRQMKRFTHAFVYRRAYSVKRKIARGGSHRVK